MKIKNPQANPKSKTQIAKKEYEKEHPKEYVGCYKCGMQVTTLIKVSEDKYICTDCKAKAKKI